MDWCDYRHTTCTCRELQSYDFLGCEVMLVSLLHLVFVISVGSLPHTDSKAKLCAGHHCAQGVHSAGLFCSLLAKAWNPNQRRFSLHLGWLSGLILEVLWSAQSLMLVVQETKDEDECAPSSSKWNHLWVPFLFPFHPQTFMVTNFFQRLLRSSEDMCSGVPVTAVLQQLSEFFSPAWGLLYMLISFPGCCIPNV